ncbi:hypothetical protein SAMN05660226_03812 [Parapedobacter luteus]|uniref:Uncharacterized protein n=1 Tax=Parapedobacter luteus TaxID=623280 RepID=A0A1T5F6C8_9SPHI|nr:hypothetical protein [Parapedobacter luteus]SKB91735.1 hypothetical protein SAMN05660226_03812 [Parapedobacter luteus]
MIGGFGPGILGDGLYDAFDCGIVKEGIDFPEGVGGIPGMDVGLNKSN